MALTTNLISYYKADEGSGTTGADAHGGNTLTVNTNLWTGSGFINGSFNGTSTTGRNISRAKITGVKTLNFWINPTNIIGAYFFSETGVGERGSGLFNATGRVVIRTNNNATIISDTADFSTGSWQMMTIVIDGASSKIYRNASPISAVITGTPDEMWGASTGADMCILNYMPTNNFPYQGKFDELGLWSVALTASEITQLYNGGAGLAYPFSVVGANSNFFQFF